MTSTRQRLSPGNLGKQENQQPSSLHPGSVLTAMFKHRLGFRHMMARDTPVIWRSALAVDRISADQCLRSRRPKLGLWVPAGPTALWLRSRQRRRSGLAPGPPAGPGGFSQLVPAPPAGPGGLLSRSRQRRRSGLAPGPPAGPGGFSQLVPAPPAGPGGLWSSSAAWADIAIMPTTHSSTDQRCGLIDLAAVSSTNGFVFAGTNVLDFTIISPRG